MNGRGEGDGSLTRNGQRYDGVHVEGHSAKNREGNGARAAGSKIAMEETALEIAVREHWR